MSSSTKNARSKKSETPSPEAAKAFAKGAKAARAARRASKPATPGSEPAALPIEAPTSTPAARKPSRAPLPAEARIVWLVDANPKTPGSKSFERFAKYFGTKTVGEYLAAGGLRADITWEAAREFLRVEPA